MQSAMVRICPVLLVFAFGCQASGQGEDSWQHFVGGGSYVTNSGSMPPLGDRIVCSLPQTGRGDIYGISCSTGQMTRLTTRDCFEASPVFANSGKTIYYVSESEGARHIWRMNADGSDQEQLTRGKVLDDLVEVSRDEGRLLIQRSDNSQRTGRFCATCLVDLKTAEAEPVCVGRYACFLRDGDEIAYVPMDALDEVWTWNVKTDERRRCTSGTLPVPAPGGGRIAVVRTGPRWELDNEICVVDLEPGKETRIGVGHSVCFMPDESGLLFYRGYERRVQFYSFEESKLFELEAPRGFKTAPTPCLDGSGCLIRVVSDDPAGDYYHFRKSTRSLVLIPMKGKGAVSRN